jgi:hypothetical protein
MPHPIADMFEGDSMQDETYGRPGLRRLILGAALATGLVVALAPHTDVVRAADLDAATVVAQNDPKTAAEAPAGAGETPKAPPGAATAGEAQAGNEGEAAIDATAPKNGAKTGNHAVIIEKGSKRIRVEGLGRDREYDSFDQFVNDAPALAGLVFLVVLLVFLVPLLIIVLLVWYKLRKNRLANETMLKLAERGAVPPNVAMDAVAAGTTPSVVAAAAGPSTPAYEQARLLHRRAVWSDLRKGVILTAIGFGLSAYSMFDDGSPNGLGLVLLFLGLGYCLLWFFEDRTREPRRETTGAPPPGAA